MKVFLAIAVSLTLLALAWLVRPLLWPAKRAGVSSQRLNASIYRDQLEALDRDLARGSISAVDFETTRDELQLRLLDDTEEPAPVQAGKGSFWSARRTAAVIALLVPLGAGTMYWKLGAPESIDPVATQKANDDQVTKMVDTLVAKLKDKPDNPQGWAMLARSYKVMGRMAEAEQAFAKVGNSLNSDPDMLVEYADLLAVQANNNFEGRPLEMVNKALALNPQHPMALMMSGLAAFGRGEFPAAVAQWEKLLPLLEPDSADAQQVEADIAEARSRGGMSASAKPAATAGAGADAGKLPPVDAATAGAMTPEKIGQMVDRLAERLKANPGDLPGWVRLATAYKVQGRLPEAEAAFAKAGALVDKDPDLLTQYADLVATRSGSLAGQPLALVNKALALNPKHPMALMLAGSAAFQRADYAQAVTHWEKALTVLPPGSRDATLLTGEIAAARSKGGIGLQLGPKP